MLVAEGCVMAMRRRLYWAVGMLLACAALVFWYRRSEGFARFVADGLSRPAAEGLMRITIRIPVPLAEILIIAGASLFAMALARAVYRDLRTASRGHAQALRNLIERAALAMSGLLLSYVLLWSAQLNAPKLAALEGQTYSTAELSSYCAELISDVNALSAKASDIDTLPRNVKFARYPELMKALGMGGVYVPWTGETIISELEPNLSLPYIAAHESAHAQGYAREDEANYIAYQTCRQSGVRSRYSGTMYALYYCMEALHDRDAVLWNQTRMEMNQAVQRDYYSLNGLRTVAAPKPGFSWRNADIAAFGDGGRGKSYGDVVDLLMADRA